MWCSVCLYKSFSPRRFYHRRRKTFVLAVNFYIEPEIVTAEKAEQARIETEQNRLQSELSECNDAERIQVIEDELFELRKAFAFTYSSSLDCVTPRNHFVFVEHFCDQPHICFQECEHLGNCKIKVEVEGQRETEEDTFVGKRSTFKFKRITTMNGQKESCAEQIPPFLEEHPGNHLCTLGADDHKCTMKCEQCGYFCTKKYDHGPIHDTCHGNILDTYKIVSNVEVCSKSIFL